MTGPGQALPASFLQRGLWPLARGAAPAEVTHVRALRMTGQIDVERLTAAVRQVGEALPALRVDLMDGEEPRLRVLPRPPEPLTVDLRGAAGAGRDAVCVALLRADRDRPAADDRHRARFHLVRLTDDEIVLALTAHGLVLDAPSLYALLGAVCQAYTGRFRAGQHRDGTTLPGLDPVTERARASRRRWWTRRLTALPGDPEKTAGPVGAGRATRTHRLRIPARRWHALTALGGPLAGNGQLAVMALAAWCLRPPGRAAATAFSTVVDLRDHLELGSLVGPFTDRLAFTVDLGGPALSFRDVLLRTQAGFLDAVVHYLPYAEVVELGVEAGRITPPRTAAHWDVALHFCRNPPTSAATRGERTLAERGLSIELFREADLLGASTTVPAGRWDGTVLDLSLGELAEDTVLVLDADLNHTHHGTAQHVLARMDQALRAAVTDPDAPLPTPADPTRSHR
ncbi:condensation domain-containing protein [Streptomyces sp. NPDC046261]|uniref:condensation domain-containing protein n=1 Tax=Streptomyces sp. NPDC046261 TaxID=3157200 RepID=UPI0033F09DEC